MKTLTRQEYYDLLVCSAFDGTFPSMTSDGSCTYDDGKGHRCAIGIIHPEPWKLKNSDGVDVLTVEHVDLLVSITGLHPEQLGDIQCAHDGPAQRSRLPFAQRPFIPHFLERINNLVIFDDVMKITGISEQSLQYSKRD